MKSTSFPFPLVALALACSSGAGSGSDDMTPPGATADPANVAAMPPGNPSVSDPSMPDPSLPATADPNVVVPSATPVPTVDTGAPIPAPEASTPVAPDPAMAPAPDDPAAVPVEPPPEPAAPVASVQFSVPSGTFQGELAVGLSPAPGGPAEAGTEIRYTVDGTLPAATSTLYDGNPLVLAETTQLRAQAFADGAASGEPATAIYVARTFDVESDIPLVIMEGYAGGRPQKETVGFGADAAEEPPPQQELIDLGFMVFEPVDGVARLSDAPVLVTRAGYRERGQSSANAEKSPYKVEFWNEYDTDSDLPVLGMPAESDWAMIGEAFDATQIKNSVAYDWGVQMGLATVRLRFVELYINFDGGPLEPTDYFGLYALTETIKNQKNRIDLKQLDETVTTMPEITGGYIFKFDQAALDNDETELVCTGSELLVRGEYDETAHCWNDLGMVDPEVLNTEQHAYLEAHIQEFHDVLHQTPIGDYAAYIDLPSFVDHTIINEITRDVDAYVRSSFFHKERDGLIKAGPLWDYNLSMGGFSSGTEGWQFESQLTGRGNDDWFYQLGSDPAFMALFVARWRELRASFLADAAVAQRIDEIAAPIQNAALRNQERWGQPPPEEEGNEEPQGGGNFGGGGFGDTIGDWQTAIDELKLYLPERMAWLDSAIEAL